MENKSNIEIIIKTIEKTVKLSNIDTKLLKELGDFLSTRTFMGMIAEETQHAVSDFLFQTDGDITVNPREPLADFFIELYCNLELSGITNDIMKSIVRNIYQVITGSISIIPNDGIKNRYINGKQIPEDTFLTVSCLIRLYITQYNNFVKNKMEKENEK